MTTTMMIKRTAVASLLALAGCATQSTTDDNADWPGYRTDSTGNLLKTADGRCWRTPNWTPAMAVPECDVAITGVPDTEAGVDTESTAKVEEAAVPVTVPAPLIIEFAFDSITISEARQVQLKAWYQQVAALDEATVEVHGYSDPLGNAHYNQALARRRADAVAQWWLQQGDDIADLNVQGHGPDRSVTGARCQSLSGSELKQCHQQDRRAVLRVTTPSAQ